MKDDKYILHEIAVALAHHIEPGHKQDPDATIDRIMRIMDSGSEPEVVPDPRPSHLRVVE